MTLTLLLKNLLFSSPPPEVPVPPSSMGLPPEERIIDDGVSKQVASQIPEWIYDEKQKFTAFLEAYYEWLERKQNAYAKTHTLYELSDLDQTLDEFVDYFSETYLKNFPKVLAQNLTTDSSVDKRKAIKNIKQFYQAKGTEKSYELLFRLMYDVPVEFYYPRDDILRVSDGIWIEPVSIKTTRTNSSSILRRLENQIITQYDGNGVFVASATVDFVLIYDDGPLQVCELFLRDIIGTFKPGFDIETKIDGVVVKERVWPVVSGVRVIDGGSGYRESDLLTYSPTGFGTNTILSVTRTNQNTGIISVGIVKSGISFFGDDVTDDGEVIDDGSSLFGGLVGTLVPDGIIPIGPGGASGGGTGGKMYFVDARNVPRTNVDASIQIDIAPKFERKVFSEVFQFGAMIYYPGYYSTNKGKLSSNKYIQDSFYFQDFSYVLKTEVSAKKWKEIIKKLIHPAGHELFGRISIKKNVKSRITHHSQLGKYETPIIARYTPYKFVTTEDLRENTLDVDLYPLGFNPLSTAEGLIPGITGARLELSGSSYLPDSFTIGQAVTGSSGSAFVAGWFVNEYTVTGGSGSNGVLFLRGLSGTFNIGDTVTGPSGSGFLGTADSSLPVQKGNGSVIFESGLTAHDTQGAPLGSTGTEGYEEALVFGIPYWKIFRHPNKLGWDKIPAGISFAGIETGDFFFMESGWQFHSDPTQAWWTVPNPYGSSVDSYTENTGNSGGSINSGLP